ncbi:MAG TPA: hypothetical protein VHT52_09015 [Stellaceae bacterium]|nr:hypothetical protein [Stellaceae bacterium]
MRVHLRRRQRLPNRWWRDLVEDAFQRSDTRRERIAIGVYGVGQHRVRTCLSGAGAWGRRMVLPAAFSAGREAGERFEYRPGIKLG